MKVQMYWYCYTLCTVTADAQGFSLHVTTNDRTLRYEINYVSKKCSCSIMCDQSSLTLPSLGKSAFSGTKEIGHSSGLEGPNPKISKPIIKPLPSPFRQKRIWANSTFLWAANRDFVKVVEKSVKFAQKCHKTGPKL